MIPMRKAIIEKVDNNKFRQGLGETRTPTHCWWECKMVQPLWKTVGRVLRMLNAESPHDPIIPPLGIYVHFKSHFMTYELYFNRLLLDIIITKGSLRD